VIRTTINFETRSNGQTLLSLCIARRHADVLIPLLQLDWAGTDPFVEVAWQARPITSMDLFRFH